MLVSLSLYIMIYFVTYADNGVYDPPRYNSHLGIRIIFHYQLRVMMNTPNTTFMKQVDWNQGLKPQPTYRRWRKITCFCIIIKQNQCSFKATNRLEVINNLLFAYNNVIHDTACNVYYNVMQRGHFTYDSIGNGSTH